MVNKMCFCANCVEWYEDEGGKLCSKCGSTLLKKDFTNIYWSKITEDQKKKYTEEAIAEINKEENADVEQKNNNKLINNISGTENASRIKKGVGFGTEILNVILWVYIIICMIGGGVVGGTIAGGGGAFLGILLGAVISYISTISIRIYINIARNIKIIADNQYNYYCSEETKKS